MPPTLLARTPGNPDPLPPYTRDPETVSIRSSAPSYISEAPSYHSSHPQSRCNVSSPLPALPSSHYYAPGFRRGISTGNVSNLRNHSFNISEWNSASNGHQARLYQNVAHRRATMANVEEEASALAAAIQTPMRGSLLSSAEMTEETGYKGNDAEFEIGSSSPLEDPELVGPEAAADARARRIYMTKCSNESEALRQENKTWDFFLAQMSDWNERERSWEQFRKEVGSSRVLGRRTGLKGKLNVG